MAAMFDRRQMLGASAALALPACAATTRARTTTTAPTHPPVNVSPERAIRILLGGTFERGEWSETPEPATIARIVASRRRLFGAFRRTA